MLAVWEKQLCIKTTYSWFFWLPIVPKIIPVYSAGPYICIVEPQLLNPLGAEAVHMSEKSVYLKLYPKIAYVYIEHWFKFNYPNTTVNTVIE